MEALEGMRSTSSLSSPRAIFRNTCSVAASRFKDSRMFREVPTKTRLRNTVTARGQRGQGKMGAQHEILPSVVTAL
eukprot:25546-Eustigmatos_ZCMA.PRE.1